MKPSGVIQSDPATLRWMKSQAGEWKVAVDWLIQAEMIASACACVMRPAAMNGFVALTTDLTYAPWFFHGGLAWQGENAAVRISGSNVRLTRCAVEGSQTRGAVVIGNQPGETTRSVMVDHCEISRYATDGIDIAPDGTVEDVAILRNYIHDGGGGKGEHNLSGNAIAVGRAARRLDATDVVLVTSRWHARRASVLVRASLLGTRARLRVATSDERMPGAHGLRELAAWSLVPLLALLAARTR